MGFVKKIILIICLINCLNLSAAEVIYTVKKGETLSDILFRFNSDHIYGKLGDLIKTLKVNPFISKRNLRENKIFPGEKLKLVVSNVDAIPESTNYLSTNQDKILAPVPTSVIPTKIPEQLPLTTDRQLADDFKQGFFWQLSPTVSWKALSSNDENTFRKSNIQAISQTCFGGAVTYGMHFEENFDVYTRATLESISFNKDSSISLVNKNLLATTLSVGGMFNHKFATELSMEDQAFLTSSTSNTIEIKKVTLPKVSFSYNKNLYQSRRANINAITTFRSFLPRSSSELETKIGYGGGAEFQFKLMNQTFGLGYDYNLLKAKTNSTTSQNIYWKYLWETI